MATKVKEIKDDALLNITVNKSYYLMTKAVSFYLFTKVDAEDKDSYLKDLMTKEYKDLDDLQRSIYTVVLLLAEIEKQASTNNLFIEKEIDEETIKQD
jgi:adenosine deaminase